MQYTVLAAANIWNKREKPETALKTSSFQGCPLLTFMCLYDVGLQLFANRFRGIRM